MPKAAQYLAQARNNETLAAKVEVDHPDWAAIALFYAALHYVEAYFCEHAGPGLPAHYRSHTTRVPRFEVASDQYMRATAV